MASEIAKDTLCVHTGTYHDQAQPGINSPIYTSSSFEYLDTDARTYPRYFNTPNQESVVKKLAALESGEDGIIFGSGMAAISTTLLALLKKEDHVLFQADLYGGTQRFITTDFPRFGIEYSFGDATNIEMFEEAIQFNTKLIYIETPSNPLLRLTDIEKIVALAKQYGVLTMIDNTFASPINQNPIPMGIDLVMHSGTKYLGGHSDLSCGAIIGSKGLVAQIKSTATHFGGNLNAQTCYLLERSLKTLALRVRQQTYNAQKLAEFMEKHPKVKKVHYPGLESHPQHDIAKRQMEGYGAMLAVELHGNADETRQFLRKLKIVTPAMSLGGVETSICEPATTSHAKISAEQRQNLGISDSLLRISVGIEATEDLIADFEQALP
ncbi:trans-sulfuration enzyme family protein [Microscilla marina]|uniref:Cystathionine beta-lyase n=1 Tax=Microscilla marina ATCC 23134 TaxID=313606 RepID=A1ZDN6_MICM2|nr:aminotransferase class I/II-fold pyridoxal phosphate-dependent enzyme [Microscilla marina]EAY31775.1 cystathionine beta-lyase [Microscilla marina ATCC 23134]